MRCPRSDVGLSRARKVLSGFIIGMLPWIRNNWPWQLAVENAFFVFLPSILLSGYLFAFRGMPVWAQAIGEIMPLTHFMRIARGILLKGNGLWDIAPEIWPIALLPPLP